MKNMAIFIMDVITKRLLLKTKTQMPHMELIRINISFEIEHEHFKRKKSLASMCSPLSKY